MWSLDTQSDINLFDVCSRSQYLSLMVLNLFAFEALNPIHDMFDRVKTCKLSMHYYFIVSAIDVVFETNLIFIKFLIQF